jgi:peptidyl-tRNA hydrolase, PTH1 family
MSRGEWRFAELKCFIGLGNPGNTYQYTRHNVGFMSIDFFARQLGVTKFQNKLKSEWAETVVGGSKVILLKPMTYMNLSGEAVRSFLDFYKADISDVTVLYDDLDTPFGQIRLRYQGSAGGHNGIKSIIQHTNTQTFNRIRIGISRPQPGNNIADYVLSAFSKEEMKGLSPILERVSEAMAFSLKNNFEKTMAKFNV